MSESSLSNMYFKIFCSTVLNGNPWVKPCTMESLGTGIDGGDADGGLAAAVLTSANRPESNNLNSVVIGMLPTYLIVCFLLSPKYLERFKYIGLVALAIVLTISIGFIADLGNWFFYSSASIVFGCLWVLLFRTRYVSKNNN